MIKTGSPNPCPFLRGCFQQPKFPVPLTSLTALISNQRVRKNVSLHSRTSASPCSFAKCKLLQNSADHWCCAASRGFTAGLYTITFRDRSALLGQSLLEREFSESVSCNLGWKFSYRTSHSLEKHLYPHVEVLGWLFVIQLSHTGLIFSALEALAKVVAVTTPLKHFSPVSKVGCRRINGTGRLLAQTCLFLTYSCYIFTNGC